MKKYFLLIFFPALFCACGIYRQNVINAPLFEKKGDLKIGGYSGFSGNEVQVSYAATNKFALLANAGCFNCKSGDEKKHYGFDRHGFKEIGIGYFKKMERDFNYEIYFGAGNGFTTHQAGSYYMGGHYERFFIQNNFGSKTKHFEFAFSPRVLFVNYYNIYDNSTNQYKHLKGSYFYFETALTTRLRIFKYLQLCQQFIITLPVTGNLESRSYAPNYFYEFSPFNASIGLIINLDLFKHSETK